MVSRKKIPTMTTAILMRADLAFRVERLLTERGGALEAGEGQEAEDGGAGDLADPGSGGQFQEVEVEVLAVGACPVPVRIRITTDRMPTRPRRSARRSAGPG